MTPDPSLGAANLVSGQKVRFGVFEFGGQPAVLRKHGVVLRLHGQPQEILALLLERPGQIVLRDEIRDRLWPSGVHVAFEMAINTAVKRLRDVLGDDADRPILIETVPRQGYRFVAPVTVVKPPIPVDTNPCADRPETAIPGAPSTIRGWRLVTLAGLLALVGLWVAFRREPNPPPSTRFAIALPPGASFERIFPGNALAFSPDSRQIVFVARNAQGANLYLRELDRFESVPIPGTEGATEPSFSPSGDWLCFIANGMLKKVAVAGGAAMALAYVGHRVSSAAWAADGYIYFSWGVGAELNESGGGPGIARIPADGGPVKGVTTPIPEAASSQWHVHPSVSADGWLLLFTVALPERRWLVMRDLSSGKQTVLATDAAHGRFAGADRVLFVRQSDLMSASLIDGALGPARPVVSGVRIGLWGSGHYALSAGGSLAYLPAVERRVDQRIAWVDRQSRIQPLEIPRGAVSSPRLSPDGKSVAVARGGTQSRIWIYRFEERTFRRLTESDRSEQSPVWHPTAPLIAYAHFPADSAFVQVFVRNLIDGSNRQLTSRTFGAQPGGWSANGEELAFAEGTHPRTGVDIKAISIKSGAIAPLLTSRANEIHPAFSPDGAWLAFAADETGEFDIFVRPAGRQSSLRQVSSGGGVEPAWSRDGRALYFRSPDGRKLFEARAGEWKPKLLLEGEFSEPDRWSRGYDPAPDGRFLMTIGRPAQPDPVILTVLNWTGQLDGAVKPPK